MKKIVGIILAGGAGKRMKTGKELKQFMEIDGIPIILYTLGTFCECSIIDDIVLVVPATELNQTEQMIEPYRVRKPIEVIAGGASRQESSFNALKHLHSRGDAHIVVIHDAVRPFVTCDLIERSVQAAEVWGVADVAAKTADTVVQVESGIVKAMPDRNQLYNGQTPQTFKFDIIYQAHKHAQKENFTDTTDDIRLVLRLGKKVKLVESTFENIKITSKLDLEIARVLARKLKSKVPQ